MTLTRFALNGLRYYWRTHATVAMGVATAVAVLAGALLVGHSVRASLLALVTSRLGHTQIVVSADQPFTAALADRVRDRLASAAPGAAPQIAPLFVLSGIAQHESSGRRAHGVSVYGVDQRFFEFHGATATAPSGTDVLLSPDLMAEIGAAQDDALVVRVARPTDIPIDSLHGQRDDTGKSMRLTVRGVIAPGAMGEFSLAPAQGPVRSVFVSLARIERDLAQAGRVNALLVDGVPASDTGVKAVRDALAAALTSDDLGLRFDVLGADMILVEAASGLIPDATTSAITSAGGRESLTATPVITWLANRITVANRTTPYSLVTGIGPDAAGDAQLAGWLKDVAANPIVINEWLARDLGAAPGQSLTLEYYRWADEGRLVTDQATFKVAGVLPMRGLAIDRRLAPVYPGITEARGVSEWDPPFPIDLKLVRPTDETYWKEYRAAPKAFVPLAIGQRLWGTRYGRLTSIRLRPSPPTAGQPPRPGKPEGLPSVLTRLATAVPASLSAVSAGFTLVDVRTQNEAASVGATDFGAYFSYFSFFLVVSALLLAALFFRLSVEQRLQQIGALRAAGYPLETIRRLWLIEGSVVALIGAAVGVLLAIGWAAFMMRGLGTWWVGAVGTTRLTLHVNWLALVVGALGGAVAGIGAAALTVRRLSRHTPRQLLSGVPDTPVTSTTSRRPALALLAMAAAIALSALSAFRVIPAAGGFFGAGVLVLVSGLLFFARWLRRVVDDGFSGRGGGLWRLGMRNASWRPGRSLTSAGLVGAAVFLIVSVDAFRKGASDETDSRSGTGGFEIFAESALPIVDDPVSLVGQASGASDFILAYLKMVPLRLRPGDDASCLNLYQPAQPRVIGVTPQIIQSDRFRFARPAATTSANPWRLLGPADAEGIVPAILDATSLQYMFHAAVGDVITIDAATQRPVRLRIVAALDDSVFQSEVLISEGAFLTLYPREAGYRVLMVDTNTTLGSFVSDVPDTVSTRIALATKVLEERLAAYGLDAQPTAARLAAFHRVENTYLSTFQTLGGLGLVLGTFGLVAVVARNVLERRRELALLGAAGFSGRDLQIVVASEHMLLVAAGLVIGTVAAIVAIAPVLFQRGASPPWLPLLWLVVVAIVGALTSFLATRSVRRLPLVASLRSE